MTHIYISGLRHQFERSHIHSDMSHQGSEQGHVGTSWEPPLLLIQCQDAMQSLFASKLHV